MERSRSLWFALVAGPAAWFLQLLLGWYFGERVCDPMSMASVRATVLVISAIALIASVGGGWLAWQNWRTFSAARHPAETDAWDRKEFMAIGGLFVSTSFTIAIIWGATASIVLSTCGWVR